MVTHSNILAWELPWTEEPGRLQFMGSQKSRTRLSKHDVQHTGTHTDTDTHTHTHTHTHTQLKNTCMPVSLETEHSGVLGPQSML